MGLSRGQQKKIPSPPPVPPPFPPYVHVLHTLSLPLSLSYDIRMRDPGQKT
jgi:hypothetical protein